MKISKIAMSVAVAAAVGLVSVAQAGDTPAANPFLSTLSTVTQAELPGKAADLVAQASTKHQQQSTIEVVKAAVGLNPAAAAAIVGSIAQNTPAMAAVAARTAARLVPNQAKAIARAAAAAAPAEAGKIVEALCQVLPANYQDLAETVAEVVPGASKNILVGVGAAIPALKEPINQALNASKSGVPSVPEVFAQVGRASPVKDLALMPNDSFSKAGVNPGVLPPYVPPVHNPNNLNPGGGGTVPPGGRVYSQP